jgi:predicted phosphoribosyltransferase
MSDVHFLDRQDAGRRLAAALSALAPEDPVVLALPRGGVPVAREIAQALHAPLDILAVRKLGAPGNPEFGVGAIAEGGIVVMRDEVAHRVGLTGAVLEDAIERERAELDRRVARYRGERPRLALNGATAVLVDDGVATGLTEIAAVRAARECGAAHVIVAVPVGARDSIALLRTEADEVVCLIEARQLISVGRWYDDFRAPSDEEVVALLAN